MSSFPRLTSALTALIRRMPRRSRRIHSEHWRTLVTNDPELAGDAADFFLSLNYRAVVTSLNEGPETRRQREQRIISLAESEADYAAEVAATQAEIINNLLEFLTPLGKKLGECTGAECARMEGFFGRVGRAIPATARVRDYLNNAELRTMFRRQQRRRGSDEQHTNH